MKVLEDYLEMGKIVSKQLTGHQDIIQVYDHKVVEKIEKCLIHQMLKGRGWVGQFKGHNNLFEKAKTHQEDGARLMHWRNLYLVITLGQVHLREQIA